MGGLQHRCRVVELQVEGRLVVDDDEQDVGAFLLRVAFGGEQRGPSWQECRDEDEDGASGRGAWRGHGAISLGSGSVGNSRGVGLAEVPPGRPGCPLPLDDDRVPVGEVPSRDGLKPGDAESKRRKTSPLAVILSRCGALMTGWPLKPTSPRRSWSPDRAAVRGDRSPALPPAIWQAADRPQIAGCTASPPCTRGTGPIQSPPAATLRRRATGRRGRPRGHT